MLWHNTVPCRRSHAWLLLRKARYEMTLHYQMTLERYPKPNRGVGIPLFMAWNLLFTGWENQEPTHRKVGSKPHLAPRKSLSKIKRTNTYSYHIAKCCILLLWWWWGKRPQSWGSCTKIHELLKRKWPFSPANDQIPLHMNSNMALTVG